MLLHLKSFLSSPQAYLAARRSFAGNTGLARWAQAESLQDIWDERTDLMAGMIAPGASVLEFGAGKERLREVLPAGCDYQPCDIVARSEHTLVCDLNQSFPPLDRIWDVIVLSGVIEYIHDVPRLLTSVRANCRGCVLSYATTDGLACMTTRLQSGWVNHLSRSAVERMLVQSGFTIDAQRSWKGQDLYRLH